MACLKECHATLVDSKGLSEHNVFGRKSQLKGGFSTAFKATVRPIWIRNAIISVLKGFAPHPSVTGLHHVGALFS